MAESYCLKSCAECGQCSGCRGGAYAARCDIAKCCREKNHESCESCTRASFCSVRNGRDKMPGKLHDQDRREAELRQAYREKAAVLAKWTRIIFWCMIAANVVGIFGLLTEFVPIFRWFHLAGSVVLGLAVACCFFRMQEADEGFHTVAVLMLIAYGIDAAVAVFLPGESVLKTIVDILAAVLGIVVMKRKTASFRDALSGISRELSEKWQKQWELYKISLFIMGGGVLLSPFIGVFVLVPIFAGLGVLLFVTIREYVYLWQTAVGCEAFSQESAGKAVDSPGETW